MMVKKEIAQQKDESGLKAKNLEAALALINKRFGDGAATLLGKSPAKEIEVISSGSLGLDVALGLGGFPRGRIIEIFGPEASGKTSIALSTIAQAQKSGGIAAFIDVEHALDVRRAKELGVDIDNLILSQPSSGEEALEICEELVNSHSVDIVVVDSVAALVPKAELEGNMGDAVMGMQARLMSQAVRKLTHSISHSNCLVVFINQIRMKIGVMFGNPETTPGGQALKFAASVRVDVRKIKNLLKGETPVGSTVRCKIVKNKVSPPFKEAEFNLMYHGGIDKVAELVTIGTKFGVLTLSGSWVSYDGQKIGQGASAASEYLKNNPKIYAEVEKKILSLAKDVGAGAVIDTAENNEDNEEA